MLYEAEQAIHKISLTEIMDAIGAVGPIIIGLAVAYIAWQQHKLSKEKFKLDLFEKRYAVYKGFHDALIQVRRYQKIVQDELDDFRDETQDAHFFFDDEIWEYREKIYKMLSDFWETQQILQAQPVGKERNELCEKESGLLRNLTGELLKLKDVFSPDLKFEKWK